MNGNRSDIRTRGLIRRHILSNRGLKGIIVSRPASVQMDGRDT